MSLLLAVQGGGPISYALSGAAGAYALTGRAAAFKVAHSLSGAAGSYSMTGRAATLAYVPGAGSVAYTLGGDAGSYALYGRDAAFDYSVSAPSFSAEIDLSPKRYYVRKGKQVLLFNSAYEADQYLEAERLAQEALEQAQKTSRRARKRLRERVYRIAHVEPVEAFELPAVASLVSRFDLPFDLPSLIQQEAWDRVMQIHALAMQMQDDEDVEMLLLM